MDSPVAGLRPVRAARFFTCRVPRPLIPIPGALFAAVHANYYQKAAPLRGMVSQMTATIGRPGFVVLLTLSILGWMGANLTIMRVGWEPWDPPPFAWLAGAAGLAALYTTVLILVTQRHDDELARQREVLTLEIALLNEQKSAKIIEMLADIRRDSPHSADRSDDQTRVMSDAADPHLILNALKDAHQSNGR